MLNSESTLGSSGEVSQQRRLYPITLLQGHDTRKSVSTTQLRGAGVVRAMAATPVKAAAEHERPFRVWVGGR